jgi:TonB family protein
MKFSSGKRIGQSGQQLTTAVLFSFFLHTILFLAALFLHYAVIPRITVPPFYAVKLVGLPSDLAAPTPVPESQTPPAPQKQQAKPAPAKSKAKKGAEKTAPKGALPDLADSNNKKKPAVDDQKKPIGSETASSAPAEAENNKVNVSLPSGIKPELQSYMQAYMQTVRNRIGANWNPPKGSSAIKVKVQFTLFRSGRIGEVTLLESSGNFYLDQAAIRSIHACNPFPALRDDFYQQKLDFSVDLTAVD